MNITDKLQEQDLRIVKALYDEWKKTMDGQLNFNAKSCDLNSVLSGLGMTKGQAGQYLKNLQDFDFIEYDKDNIKLLPSGINYALGHFDNIQ